MNRMLLVSPSQCFTINILTQQIFTCEKSSLSNIYTSLLELVQEPIITPFMVLFPKGETDSFQQVCSLLLRKEMQP